MRLLLPFEHRVGMGVDTCSRSSLPEALQRRVGSIGVTSLLPAAKSWTTTRMIDATLLQPLLLPLRSLRRTRLHHQLQCGLPTPHGRRPHHSSRRRTRNHSRRPINSVAACSAIVALTAPPATTMEMAAVARATSMGVEAWLAASTMETTAKARLRCVWDELPAAAALPGCCSEDFLRSRGHPRPLPSCIPWQQSLTWQGLKRHFPPSQTLLLTCNDLA